MKTGGLSISELFELIRKDDAEAFRELYTRYKEPVFLIVKRRVPDTEDARDVTQEVFIYLWNSRDKLADLHNFDSWLYAVVRNKVISAYRKRSIRLKSELLLANAVEALDWDSEAIVVAKELDRKVEEIISTMPATMQNCYKLSRREGLDNHEIAKLLDLSEKTVRNNLSETSKRLQSALAPHYPEFLTFLFLLHHQ